MSPGSISRNLLVNRDKPPFDNADLRRAMALSLDRQAFIDTITEGKGEIGGAMQPAPAGVWGMPPELLQKLPGYDPDITKNRAEARRIMENLGYGPDKRLSIKLSTRDIPFFRDPAVILIHQLKQVYKACRRRCPANHLLQPGRDLLAALRERAADYGQQHL